MLGKVGVVVVGQTPPPMGGQAVMLKYLLEGSYETVRLHHARMSFSKQLSQTGKFGPAKVLELVNVVWRIVHLRFKYSAKVLYFPPSGPSRLPLYRDIFILGLTRWLFTDLVLHFHASGLSEYYSRLTRAERWLVRRAMFKASAAIRISPAAPDEGKFTAARNNFTVLNGIPDIASGASGPTETDTPVVLFVGLICSGKGIDRVLETAHELMRAEVQFRLVIAGEFDSPATKSRVEGFCLRNGLSPHVDFPGVVTGAAKKQLFRTARVFLFPTLFESETFPVVILEAMAAGVPTVASDWRGIPDMIEDGVSGFLVPNGDPGCCAEKVQLILEDERLRSRLGQSARSKYDAKYTLEEHRRSMNEVFSRLTHDIQRRTK